MAIKAASLFNGIDPVLFRKSLLQGTAVAGLLLLLLPGYALLNRNSLYEEMDSHLASQMVNILRAQNEHPVVQAHIDHSATTATADKNKDGVALPAPENEDSLYELLEGSISVPAMPEKGSPSIFNLYKKPFNIPEDTTEKPVISLAVMDYGLSDSLSLSAAKSLPPEISFILNPYSKSGQSWSDLARKFGHELWLGLPFENENVPNDDTGALTLMAKSPLRRNQDTFHAILAQVRGYVGTVGYSDGVYMAALPVYSTIMRENFQRGLGYMELNPSADPAIKKQAQDMAAPYLKTAIIADPASTDFESFEQSLEALKLKARFSGNAFGVITLNQRSMQAISAWYKTLEAEGFTLAPASALASSSSPLAKLIEEKNQTEAPSSEETDTTSQHEEGDVLHNE